MSCLEKNPDDRPPSAAALAEQLAQCQDAQGWTPERARQWWKQQQVAEDPFVGEDTAATCELTVGINWDARLEERQH